MKQSHNNIRPLFITHNKEKEAIKSLFVGNVKVVVYTKGSDGANIYLKNGEEYEDKGFKVIVSDTTWAGDAFIGGFLSELVSLEISNENLCERVINDYLLLQMQVKHSLLP
ncbi:carbohydrate kinase family protein [Peribacillus sp. NJ11]|uniref:carbohydrate kinase family protein n=1 Tax=Peribacillus sp. NJ11 TaxID=3055861 RepID=UPI0025A192D5|nr:carbohydrate kinase family protein [Peribacillus sp. NJ11]MDM5223411.1 carbohydrate kinase family protein [Peribacillus sp. NJ11]